MPSLKFETSVTLSEAQEQALAIEIGEVQTLENEVTACSSLSETLAFTLLL